MDEVKGSKVSEDISQAWVLSNWTRSLLTHRQPGAHLTCPALMTDIKLVSPSPTPVHAHTHIHLHFIEWAIEGGVCIKCYTCACVLAGG